MLAAQPLVSAEGSTRSAVYRIEETHQLPNNSTSDATNVEATIFLLDDRLDYAGQEVLSEEIKVDGAPASPDISQTADNRVARFSLGTIGAGASKTITITQIIRVDHLGPINPSAVQEGVPSVDPIYTQPIPNLWESDNPVLENKALELIAGESNLYYQAKAIFDFVENHLFYIVQTEDHSALQAYNSRVGDCSEFTHLFSALCRAAGIPTRFVSGYGYDPTAGGNLTNMAHAFAFIYLPGPEWVPMDLTWNRPNGMFGELSDDHLIELTSDGGNLVSGSKIQIPGNRVNYNFSGTNPDINFESTYGITRVIAVEPTIHAGSKIQDSTWRFTVIVSNEGSQNVSNVNVELQVDEDYFETPPAENIGDLGAGLHQNVYFDVGVKQTVENSLVTAVVTYDSSYGTFQAEGRLSTSATLFPPVSELPVDLLLILLVCVVGVIAAVAVVLLRR